MLRATTTGSSLGLLLALSQGCAASDRASLSTPDVTIAVSGEGAGIGTSAGSVSGGYDPYAPPVEKKLFGDIRFTQTVSTWVSEMLCKDALRSIFPDLKFSSDSLSCAFTASDIENIKKRFNDPTFTLKTTDGSFSIQTVDTRISSPSAQPGSRLFLRYDIWIVVVPTKIP